ncbi:MAG: lysophospholipase [Pseudarthrobacter sp.]|nr:lysophospholipase [Pseudarthrobacter sp.]
MTATNTEALAAATLWDTPSGVTPRGTLVLLAGRGEHPGIYARFGRRLSSDGYRVHVLGPDTAETGHDRAARLLASSDPRTPRVVVGSDSGAALALGRGVSGPSGKARPDAIVVAALPLGSAVTSLPDAEARSACPLHRGILADHANLDAGALARPVSADSLPAPEDVQPPVLVFHGELDPVVPVDDAARWVSRLPHGRLVTTSGGLRDALNDTSHRSVAATLVLFLEDLRAGHPLLK